MQFRVDKSLLLVILFFIGLGVVQVYSSSYIFATENYSDGLHFFRRQFIFAIIGVLVLLATARVPWQFFEKWSILIWFVASLGVVATLVPSLTVKAGGASRWINMPFGLRFEPAELLKIGYPFLIASFVAKEFKFLGKYRRVIQALVATSVLILLLKQPDFGSFVICSLIIFSILFTFGLKWRYIMLSVATMIPLFYFLVVSVPYRYARIAAFLDPWADPSHKGFQAIQSMLSFHSGGLWGVGLGQGQGKLFFLPEAHTDFSLAVLGEEIGFLGFSFVLLLYGFLLHRGLQISLHTESRFARAVAVGLTTAFGLSVIINVGVVLGLLPTKGLTLPFMSYGGSSLLCTCFAFGVLLNIDRHNRRTREKKSFSGYSI